MGRQRHRELGTGKEGERGVAVVHERDDEEPEGVVDEGERERGESEGAEGSVTHGRGIEWGTLAERRRMDLIKSNYADGAWTRWRQRWMYSQKNWVWWAFGACARGSRRDRPRREPASSRSAALASFAGPRRRRCRRDRDRRRLGLTLACALPGT